MPAEHGFKMEQKKDNKVDTTGKTPKNKDNRRSAPNKKPGMQMDPALLQAIMMMLAQREGSVPGGPGGPGMPGGPAGPGGPGLASLPPGAVPMGPPPGQNPAIQGRMGLMPPVPGGMPPGGMPVR